MPLSADRLRQIDTPSVLVDLGIAKAIIGRFQADSHGRKVRPHIKTHKLPMRAELQLTAGAIGISCQKTPEAEAMMEGVLPSATCLISYNIVGEQKLRRLKALAHKVALSVVADSTAVIDSLSATFRTADRPLTVLVECNTGANRCGVASPSEAEALAVHIDGVPGLIFGGFMTYPPSGGEAAVQAFLTEAKARVEVYGIAVRVITSGGTPTMMHAGDAPVTTEYRPGTYIYNDRSLVARGTYGWEDCALTVLATVVSVPTGNPAIIDAGSKTLTSDLLGFTGYGHVLGRDDIAIDQHSEEHGRLVSNGPINLKVGDRMQIVPNHACVVANR